MKPKYADPEHSHLTWSGRGRMARWLQERLAAGAELEDFLIDKPEGAPEPSGDDPRRNG